MKPLRHGRPAAATVLASRRCACSRSCRPRPVPPPVPWATGTATSPALDPRQTILFFGAAIHADPVSPAAMTFTTSAVEVAADADHPAAPGAEARCRARSCQGGLAYCRIPHAHDLYRARSAGWRAGCEQQHRLFASPPTATARRASSTRTSWADPVDRHSHAYKYVKITDVLLSSRDLDGRDQRLPSARPRPRRHLWLGYVPGAPEVALSGATQAGGRCRAAPPAGQRGRRRGICRPAALSLALPRRRQTANELASPTRSLKRSHAVDGKCRGPARC